MHEQKKKKTFSRPELTVQQLSEELILTNLKLQEANRQLRENEQARTEMFSNISHDLRSPITAIKNAVDYLSSLEYITQEELTPMLKLMSTRIYSLENLINNIFLLASLKNHHVKFNLSPIEIGTFLEDYFFSCEADTKYEKRNLILNVPNDFSYPVNIDTEQLIRVLDNLFTNALKYSYPDSDITLGAYKNNDFIVIFIEDTGMGMELSQCKKIFEYSYTIEKARTPGISSTGLGLSIVKTIIEQLHGTIWCESELKKGSRFSFQLPILKR